MSDQAVALLVGLGAGVACALVALAMPRLVVARLPEPAPDPVPEEGVELTASQRARLEEPPKEPYAAMAVAPGFAATLAWVSGVVGAILGWSVGADWVLLLLLPLVPIGTVLAVVDLRTRLLPSRIVLPATAAALVFGLVAWPVVGSADDLVRGVVGLVVARSLFWVMWLVYPSGMGFGDVRLTALLGFVLGYLGWAELVVGLYSPFLIFALPGLAIAVVRRDPKLLKQHFPFGPFLLAGAVIGIVVGDPLVDAFLHR